MKILTINYYKNKIYSNLYIMPKRYVRKRKFVPKTKRRIQKGVAMVTKIQRAPRGPLSMYNAVNPFPVNYNAKFVYSGDFVLASQSGAGGNKIGNPKQFRLNSIYDPNMDVGVDADNTPCYGFKQLLSGNGPYTHYKVSAAKIEILFYAPDQQTSGADGICGIVSIQGVQGLVSVSGKELEYAERAPMTVVKRVADTGNQRRRVVQYLPMNMLFGYTREQFRAEMNETVARYDANPGLTPVLEVACANALGDTTVYVRAKVKITYYAQCYNRLNLVGQEASA